MTETRWRKSRFSGGGQTNCVEVAHGLDALRDSKSTRGPILAANVRALVASIRQGRFDR